MVGGYGMAPHMQHWGGALRFHQQERERGRVSPAFHDVHFTHSAPQPRHSGALD